MTEILYVTEIKPYSPVELSRIYGVSKKTFNRWLKPHREAIGERQGLYYTTLQVKLIFEKLGLPSRIEE
jgi:hypothetical protein